MTTKVYEWRVVTVHYEKWLQLFTERDPQSPHCILTALRPEECKLMPKSTITLKMILSIIVSMTSIYKAQSQHTERN